jgi:hypothetical protein
LPWIARSGSAYLTEALVSAVAQHSDEAKALKTFREKRAPKTVRN